MKIVGPDNLKELIEDGYQRCLVPSVLVEVDGKIIELEILTPDRIKSEIDAGLEFYGCYMIPSNYIVVDGDITLEKIERALAIVSKGSDFKKNLLSSK